MQRARLHPIDRLHLWRIQLSIKIILITLNIQLRAVQVIRRDIAAWTKATQRRNSLRKERQS